MQADDLRRIREYEGFMANAPVAIGFSRSGTIMRYNVRFGELFGFAGESGVGQPTVCLYPSADALAEIGKRAFPLLSQGRPFESEMLMRRQSGEVFWAHAVAYLIDPHDRETETVWIISDISERKAGEHVQRNLLLDLGAIVDNASVGILFSRNRRVDRCNHRAEEILGYPPGELTGLPGVAIYPSQDHYDELGRAAGPLLSAGESYTAELQFKRRDGSLVWCHIYARAVDPDDNTGGTVWIIEDIDEAKATRDALQHSIHQFEAFMANAPVAIGFTRQRRIVRYNDRFGQMFGFAGDTGIGQPTLTLYPNPSAMDETSLRATPLLSQGKPFESEMLLRRQNGQTFWVQAVAYLVDPNAPGSETAWILSDITERKASEQAQRDILLDLNAIVDNASIGILFSRNRLVERCNRRAEEILGYAPGTLAGQPARAIYVSDESYESMGREAGPVLSRGEAYSSEWRFLRRDGSGVWTHFYARAVDPDNNTRGTVWIVEDISEAKATREALQRSMHELEAVMSNASVGILYTRDRRILRYNKCFADMFGFGADDGVGEPGRGLYPSDEAYAEVGRQAGPLLSAGKPFQSELFMTRRDGTNFWANLIGYVLDPNDTANGTIWIVEDRSIHRATEDALHDAKKQLERRVRERTAELEAEVTERRRAEDRLRHMAHHDSLTGLPNRTLLQLRLGEALDRARRDGAEVALLFIDLDRFKLINDSLGHYVGDVLLKQVARRIQDAVRGTDTVARIGGDEFVIVLPGLGNVRRAVRVAEKVDECLRPPLRITQHELFVTPSIGICVYPRDGEDVETLMRNADTAMYAAKSAGRNTFRFFEASMNAAADQYFQIESSLRKAIERQELALHYQPLLNLETGAMASMEALLRWRHPQLGMVPPIRFIPVAEESGLIGEIGRWVLAEACRQIGAWRLAGLTPPPIAVNLSPFQFRNPDLIGDIVAVIEQSGIEPSCVEFEITETALMQDGEQTLTKLRALADLGTHISVDDFGTGYSSLAYLKRYPVSKLKIDRSFIIDMIEDDSDRAIVRTIISLAESMDLRVVAEGVETEEQAAILRALGCDYAQGYLYSRPLPADEIAARLLGASIPRRA